MSVAAVRDKIRIDTAACVEQRKRGKGWLGGFLTTRRSLEPECEQQAYNKYAGELAAEQLAEDRVKNALDDAFKKKVSGDNSRLYSIIILVFIFLVIVTIIIY